MTKAQILSVRTNNLFSLILGLATIFYILFVLTLSTWSDQSEFLGMVALGSLM